MMNRIANTSNAIGIKRVTRQSQASEKKDSGFTFGYSLFNISLAFAFGYPQLVFSQIVEASIT